ncbi:MAG: hypothetical protein IPH16_01320 [Haliscomenobacter sp.]|nr:hypothetical protein [Haliscomenobacter sp.]MBK7477097.1 hypothetical protein [Haliscomenobacter sp.]MBK8878588.1 hypothetical protein [Haliscomenobacter sp.]
MTDEGKYQQIKEAILPFIPMIGKAADTIIDENVSNYPIFVVSQLDIDLGIPLVKRTEEGSLWSVHASTLEEMSAKRVIQEEKVTRFRDVYKDPRDYVCLFVLSDLGAIFIFLPRD